MTAQEENRMNVACESIAANAGVLARIVEEAPLDVTAPPALLALEAAAQAIAAIVALDEIGGESARRIVALEG